MFGFGQGFQDSYTPPAERRQLSQQKTIAVQCEADKLVVTVQRDLYGNGVPAKPSDMVLGSQLCKPTSQSTNTILVFQYGLQQCGIRLQMTPEWMIYATQLIYNPTPTSNSLIIRTNSAVIPINCYYPRQGNVSSNAIKPTWAPFSTTVSFEDKLVFSLQLMNDDWSSIRTSSVFHLGEVFHIEASISSVNHMPMTVYVDSCVATLTTDIYSSPRYEIIAANGCLLDGKQEDSSSAFRAPRMQPDKLQFTVDAFRFTGKDISMIYITCNLKAAALTQAPDTMHKACSFNKATNIWSSTEGPSNICNCCDAGNCVVTPGQSRGRGPYYTGSRRNWKREAETGNWLLEEEEAIATLGPLMVIGSAEKIEFSSILENNNKLELWLLQGNIKSEFEIIAQD
ncbi:zona pellucida sperm-binding protein 3-like [Bombina bombina]|uniref:zona pellucida sperm-binding protein 3-like n=1 Tax=Bombina bombina TaxID=8345 RepID=UPI00235A8E53|nr:zona pellucida sperm-binding protein 3-like [Bombina bombina]